MMQQKNIDKTVTRSLLSEARNMELVPLEIGLQRDLIYKVLRWLLLRALKEFTEAI